MNLIDYIRDQTNLGYDAHSIKSYLLKQGYSEAMIENAFQIFSQEEKRSSSTDLESYIRDQRKQGVGEAELKQDLLSHGYNLHTIERALRDTKAPRFHKKHVLVLIPIVIIALLIYVMISYEAPQEIVVEDELSLSLEKTELESDDVLQLQVSSTRSLSALIEISYNDVSIHRETLQINQGDTSLTLTPPITDEGTYRVLISSKDISDSVSYTIKKPLLPPVKKPPEQIEAIDTKIRDDLRRPAKEAPSDPICEEQKGIDRDNCYRTQAQNTNDLSLCEKIENSDTQDLCKSFILFETEDFSKCETIMNEKLRKSCEVMR